MNRYFYNIPLGQILKQINLNDLYQVMNTPDLRNLVLSSATLDELENRIIINCIDDLEKKLQTNLFYELLDEFFIPKGYDQVTEQMKQDENYRETMNNMYEKLLDFEEFDDEVVSEINEMRENDVDFYQIKDFLTPWQESYNEIKDLMMDTDQKLESILERYNNEFKEYLFQSSKNVKEYLGVVEQYVDQYVDDDEVNTNFHQCVKRLGKVKKLLLSSMKTKPISSRMM